MLKSFKKILSKKQFEKDFKKEIQKIKNKHTLNQFLANRFDVPSNVPYLLRHWLLTSRHVSLFFDNVVPSPKNKKIKIKIKKKERRRRRIL